MRLRQEQIPQAQGIKPFYSLSFSCEVYCPLEAAVSAAAAAQKDQQNQTAVVVIISAATAIIVSAASQKDQDPENAAAVSVSAPEIKQSVSIAPIAASAVTSIVTSTVPFASAVCSSDITH